MSLWLVEYPMKGAVKNLVMNSVCIRTGEYILLSDRIEMKRKDGSASFRL